MVTRLYRNKGTVIVQMKKENKTITWLDLVLYVEVKSRIEFHNVLTSLFLLKFHNAHFK